MGKQNEVISPDYQTVLDECEAKNTRPNVAGYTKAFYDRWAANPSADTMADLVFWLACDYELEEEETERFVLWLRERCGEPGEMA